MVTTKVRLFSYITSFVVFSFIPDQAFAQSTCYGTAAKGRLEKGVILPKKGENFSVYSETAWMLGRTYVHSTVRDIIVRAYDHLKRAMPTKVFLYGETGWEQGGSFKPHKTHQNGLSVDFMVPVTDSSGKSVPLPCSILNKFCYSIEFDGSGKFDEFTIDFEAMAEHIHQLSEAAKKRKAVIKKVIFDPKLLPLLMKTKKWDNLQSKIRFVREEVWVRHDEHYHVDFKIPCEKLK